MDKIRDYLIRSRDVLESALADDAFVRSLADVTDAVAASLAAGGKLLTLGNGGSAADAQHIAGEFVSRLNYDRGPAASVALTTDTSVLTAVGNDYGYEHVFSRQVLAIGRRGDVLLAISTSGRSPSVLSAMRAARDLGMVVVAFTGRSGGDMPPLSDLVVHAPSDSTPLIQQVHITAAHIVCGLVEERLFPRGAA
ncbi:MAG: D-sedoheptulose 7-phosphate isomerase [Methylobacteriaceae bacterium]|nr:D-sedoheptulose 7-phosphate isomerase [Methylobacteriaceae bacterium]